MITKILQRNIPKGWEIKKIKDLLDFEQPTKYIVESSSYPPDGKTPVLTANKSFVLGHTNEIDGVYTRTPVIIFDDFTTDCKYVDFPFKIKSSAIKLLTNRDENTDLKFVYEIMKSLTFPIANHKRHYISQYQELDIIVPSIKEQKKIAEILSTVDDEISKTEEIVSATEKLKNALVEKLFSTASSKIKLSEISSLITKGTTPTTYGHSFTDEGVNFFKIENIDESGNIDLSSCKRISEETHQFLKRSQLAEGDVLFSIAGALGRIAVIESFHLPANINQAIAIIRLKDKKDAGFVSQVLKTDYVKKQVVGSSVQLAQANISLGKLGEITIPWPKVEERQKISNIIQSVDEKIAINKKIKSNLLLLKKGLMNDLLTGKVRTT